MLVYAMCALMWGTRLRQITIRTPPRVGLAEGHMTEGASASQRLVPGTSWADSDATQSIRRPSNATKKNCVTGSLFVVC